MHDDIRPPKAPREPVEPTQEPQPLQEQASSDQIAHVDEQKIAEEFGPIPNSEAIDDQPTGGLRHKMMKLLPAFSRSRHHSRHLTLVLALIALGLLIVGGGAVFAYVRYYHPPIPHIAAVHYPPKPKKPVLVPSTLTGLLVDPSVNDRPVTGVMIENSIDARPQSGLDQAGVVFEAIAEGGVTRFLALFQDSQPDYLGPVRSARPYYIQWLLGFDGAYAHVGGSPDALNDIKSWGVKDLNQFYNAGAYQRISSRYAPHNVYTSIAQLNQLEASKGFGKSSYTGFTRKKKEEPSKTPNATSIDIKFSGYYYDTHYDYDASTNTYKRSESGAPHMELKSDGSQVQIAPKVVVAMIVPRQNGALDASGAYYSDYASIGSGQIVVFQDGIFQTGTWTKTSNTSQITFTDANGKPLALNPGQTWIAATPLASNVTYK
jgi:hypothetical protein